MLQGFGEHDGKEAEVSKSFQDAMDAAPPGTFTPAMRLDHPLTPPGGGVGNVTVIAAEAALAVSATLVAVTVNVPAVAGAV